VLGLGVGLGLDYVVLTSVDRDKLEDQVGLGFGLG
jgi:lipoate synthase